MKRRFIALACLIAYNFLQADIDPATVKESSKFPKVIHSYIQPEYPLVFSGYIRQETFWDTRQVFGFSQNELVIFPLPKVYDPNCNDLNARGQFNMLSIQSRLRATMNGPHIRNAASKGILEADFFGRVDIANMFRLRHAFIDLDWQQVDLLAGQTWHPLYTLECYPRTISYNGGIPIDPGVRNPQARFIGRATKNLNIMLCATTELDNASDGPIGFSTTYMRNAIMPMLDAQFKFNVGDQKFGIAAEVKRIVPRLVTNTGYQAHESLMSGIVMAYHNITLNRFSMYNKTGFVQNPTDLVLIGGYAVESIDPISDQRTYANLDGFFYWNDTEFKVRDSLRAGWFLGIIKNIGARRTILLDVKNNAGVVTERRVYGLGTTINNLFRVSPRFIWRINNFEFCGEVEYTRAAYGTLNNQGEVIDTNPVADTRISFSMFYYL